jgi:hypothetical protein
VITREPAADTLFENGVIQKIYEIGPLTGPKCQERMETFSFAEDEGLAGEFLQK